MKIFAGTVASSVYPTVGDDDAANYSSFSGTTPANGGYGFDGWSIVPFDTGGIYRAGVGASFGNINTGGNSFAAYGNPNDDGNADGVNIQRNLNKALSVGYALSGVCAINYRNGGKGFSAYSDTGFQNQIFNMNVGDLGIPNNDGYFINEARQSVNYRANMIISIVLKQVTASTFTWSVRYFGDTPNGTQDITVNSASPNSGLIRGFKWYIFDTSNQDDPNNNLFFNSMKIYRYV